MQQLDEVQFGPLASAANVFSLACCSTGALGVSVVLIATRAASVIRLALNRACRPVPVPFVGLPANSDIVAISAYAPSATSLLVAIAFLKPTAIASHPQPFLNVYGLSADSTDIDQIATDCQTLSLDFVPLKISNLLLPGEQMLSFVIGGIDTPPRIFRKEKALLEPLKVPGIVNLPNGVISIDALFEDNRCFMMAVGCQDGLVQLLHETASGGDWQCNSIYFDGPICSVRLFREFSRSLKEGERNKINLAVACTIGDVIIYRDVVHGVGLARTIPNSSSYDTVLCLWIADINWDGRNEILVGSYGRELVAYGVVDQDGSLDFPVIAKHSFVNSVCCINYLPLLNNGMRELLVVTLHGVHILQHDFSQAYETILQRLQENRNHECSTENVRGESPTLCMTINT